MKRYEPRISIIIGVMVFVGLIFLARLFYIQVIDNSFILSADNQSLRYVTQFAPRGLIYDRNGKKMVFNLAAYNLMVTPRNVKDIDTVRFCELVGITREEFIKRMEKATIYSRYKASVFEKLIPSQQYANIADNLYLFPGFSGVKTSVRNIPYHAAGHIIGYLSEVGPELLNDSTFDRGDYIGRMGLEKSYDTLLRGANGHNVFIANKYNVIQASYKNGLYDELAIPGKGIQTTIDIDLQMYGESLMQNKKGSIVAIDPQTGEILSFISSPTYDPNLLVGRDRSKNYADLVANDSLNPLFNRALMAEYPPGSIFKLIQALIALQEGHIVTQTGFSCNKALVGCHDHPAPSNLNNAIQFSCNPYFYNVFRKIIQPGVISNKFKDSERGLNIWNYHVRSFGLGSKLGIDLDGDRNGIIPNSIFYDKIYGHNRWAFSTIYSLSIGQGEISISPLQMANIAVILANRGYYYRPHLVKKIGDSDTISPYYTQRQNTTIESQYFTPIVQGMQAVVENPHGTARRARIGEVSIAGKTGTAENPHGEDHSIFICFAPVENPKIAISVYIENAGFGGTWAAPIASLMAEKYLLGEIKNKEKEQRILDANLLNVIKDEK